MLDVLCHDVFVQGALHCVEVELGNEIANKMSMFYAEATPMLKFVSDVTATFVSQVTMARMMWMLRIQ